LTGRSEQSGVPRPARSSLRWILLLMLLSTVLPPPGLAQSDEEKTRGELRELEADIKRITSEITADTNRQSELQAQLRDTEKALGALQREIREKQRALQAGREQLAALEQRHGEQEEARDRQQARIALELKTAWKLGRQGQLKVLLSQESPHTVARSLAYYRYFFEARNELLEQYRQTLRELAELQQRIETTVAELDEQRRSLEEREADLTAAQDRHKEVVARLADSISSKSAQLKQKEQDRKRLEDLLRAIEEAVVNLDVPRDYQAFESARGGMPWPVKGKPSNQFDRPRNEGKMRWQGLTIPAVQGTVVRAIHHGRVVYADWLRGSGLLLIIDHGDGYMSLYAHNESLLREVGEWVATGDPVSTVGNSGGEHDYALYFEIRHDGKPVNPSKWCRG
jgi:septal ring factor EnvC (AmiA/AmiB activator)